MKTIDPHRIAEYIKEVAHEKILPRYQNLADHEIDTKTGPNDLVTIADREAEETLEKIFKDILPGSLVVGEEGVSADTSKVSFLKDQDSPVWIIDPVDGTGNFARGEKIFGSMVALTYKGECLQGFIFDILGERMGIAEAGAGCEVNGKRCILKQTETHTPFAHMKGYIATGFVPKEIRGDILPKLKEFEVANALQCCAHEYLNLIEGQRDFSFYKRMKPWDHLPGLLLYKEAGGYSRNWMGHPHVIHDDTSGIINAPKKEIWDRLKALLLPPEIEELIQRKIAQ